jgi:hypothetical protein
MSDATDTTALLAGPYKPPALYKGDRAFCLYRDTDMIITSWTDAPKSWPRCRAYDSPGGGGSGILVEDELARAIRTESAAAVGFWWGVSEHTVWRWRMTLGVDRKNNPGTVRLTAIASEKGAAKVRGKKLEPEQVEAMRKRAKEMNQGRFIAPHRRPGGRPWPQEELALLGTADDDVIPKC